MAAPALVDRVKLFVAALFGEEEPFEEALHRARERWGEIDYQGPDHPFDLTDYYEREMGPGLKRRLVSFSPLVAPERIVEAKLQANEIEEALRVPRGRRANLDVGYLDLHKVVLASLKYGPLKVHLGRGVYADLVSRYSQGRFHPFEWTFQDFRDGRYDRELLRIRELYKSQLRGSG